MECLEQNVRKDAEAVLCYHSDEKYFFLGLQTIAQRSLFQKFASNIVCIDATHSTNRKKLLLITVLILDDAWQGLLAAWFLCNQENEQSLTIFLKTLKKESAPIEAKVFMRDDANQYFNAWSKIFLSAQTKKLLHTSHVLRNWLRNLQTKVKTTDTRKLVWDILKRMLRIPDAEQYDRAKCIFLEVLSKFSSEFKTYFEENYCTEKRLPQWTAYSQQNICINMNMHIQCFRHTLKYNFLNKHENHPLDFLFYTLLEVAKFYTENYHVCCNLIGATGNISEIQRRHKHSEEIDPLEVQIFDDLWEVKLAKVKNDSDIF